MTEVVSQEVQPAGTLSFIRTKHDLTKALKRLERETDSAVDFLVSILGKENVDTKVQLEAAKTLLEYRVKVSDMMNKDALNRMIAEVRLLNPRPSGTRTVGGEPLELPTEKPVLDFEYVQKV